VSSLLKFQIGPVQDFIAASRSTRDLWSGSFLLSWLVAAGMRELRAGGSELIFPDPADQSLLGNPDRFREIKDGKSLQRLLTPNLPNLFVARIGGEPVEIAGGVRDAIQNEWHSIADEVLKMLGLDREAEDLFCRQVDRHLSITWQSTPLAQSYEQAYQINGWHLDAVRQLRDFKPAPNSPDRRPADSLTGTHASLGHGADFRHRRENLFKHENDEFGAITLVKRLWHIAYLQTCRGISIDAPDCKIRSIPAIAAGGDTADDDELPQEKAPGERYVAAIAFDGDSIGRWVNGDFLARLPEPPPLDEHHARLSARLSHFALERVRQVVDEHRGFLIYSGGDDVLALVPADAALECASALRQSFRDATSTISGIDPQAPGEIIHPDASAGIAIAHIRSPLQDLVRSARAAEKRAKKIVGKPAFSITLLKRSGEITEWGARWDHGGLDLFEAIDHRLAHSRLSSRFPHRVCQLLSPYLTSGSGLGQQADALAVETARDLTTLEFLHAIRRHSPDGDRAENLERLEALLDRYLQNLPSDPQSCFAETIGLCTAAAFAHRNRPAPGAAGAATAATT